MNSTATTFIKTLPCHRHYVQQAKAAQTCSLSTQDRIIIHLVAGTLLETYLVTDCIVRRICMCVYIRNVSPWYCVPHTFSNYDYTFMGRRCKNIEVASLTHPKLSFALVNSLYVFGQNTPTQVSDSLSTASSFHPELFWLCSDYICQFCIVCVFKETVL
jgi:hypothetical protein